MTAVPVIALRGVRVHNLRGIDVDLPLGKLTAITGVSGAGKSSLVFDTLFAEAQRRYLQSFSVAIRQHLERFDQPDADHIGDLLPAIAVRRRGAVSADRATVGSVTEVSDYLRLLLVRAGTVQCPNCQTPVQPAGAQDVLAAIQAMPAGQRLAIAFPSRPEPDQDIAGWAAALREEGFLRLQVDDLPSRLDEALPPTLPDAAKVWVLVDRVEIGTTALDRVRDSSETAFTRGQGRLALLTDQGERIFDRNWQCPGCNRPCPEPTTRLLDCDDPLGACPQCQGSGVCIPPSPQRGRGVGGEGTPCPVCQGQRWNENAQSVRLDGMTIAELSTMNLKALAAFVESAPPRSDTALLQSQLRQRLAFLIDVELGYLHLARAAATLATGERKRLDLCASLTNNLVGALYLLDEPSAGLHSRDLDKLRAQLIQLRDAGNTVVMVEHHADLIRTADHIVDLGPGAGDEGGCVVVQGTEADLVAAAASVTGEYLGGRAVIPIPTSRKRPSQWLHLRGATLHNLRDLTVDFPLGVLGVVTGVSGAGKSSLVERTLLPCLARDHGAKTGIGPPPGVQVQGAGRINDVLLMDQAPLPRSARSNPATYLKLFDEIRDLFAETAEAKIRGFGAGHFSFNQPGGRCDACSGQGTLTVDMQFLADVTMTCPECLGRRFTKDVLNVKVRSLSIADVLNLTAREAFRFFRAQGGLQRKLKWLLDVGLDYLRLGQPTDTLSGGECQRLKLAGRLASNRKPRCLFVLLEPSAGLHPLDVQRLLDCCDRLVQTGHSVLVIDHNLDVIKCADYVIDLGPGAGPDGGRVVAKGTPEEVAQVNESHTGRFLKKALTP